MNTNSKIILYQHIVLGFVAGIFLVIMDINLCLQISSATIKSIYLSKTKIFIHISVPFALAVIAGIIGLIRIRLVDTKTLLRINQAEHQISLGQLNDYKFALDQAAIITVIDDKGKIKGVNKNFETLTGLLQQDVKGRAVWRLPSSLQMEGVFQQIKNDCDAGKVWKGEIEYYKEDSSIIYTSALVVPLSQKADGNNDCLVIQYDTSAEKKTAMALSKSEKEKDFILTNTQTLICKHDLNGTLTHINLAGADLIGLPANEIIGRPLKDFIDSRFSFTDYLKTLKEERKSEGYMKLITKDGNSRMLYYRNILSTDENNLEVIGSAMDLTETLQIQMEVEKQRAFNNEVVNTSPNLICVVDEDNKMNLVNENFLSFFDLPDGENMKHLTTAINFRPDIARMLTPENTEDENTMKYGVYECRLRNCKTRELKWFKIQTTVFEVFGKSYKSYIATDVSEKNAKEAKLMLANAKVEGSLKMKEEFIANMSHEIRTPLNAIIGFTDLLEETKLDIRQGDYVKTVKIAGQNLLSIINDILDLSKIETGNITLINKPFNLAGTIENIKKLFEPKVYEKGIKLNTFISDALPDMVFSDEIRLNQALINLVGNAVKFTNKGSVDIIVKPVKSQTKGIVNIHFSIKDTGIGIAKEKIGIIFERYLQATPDIHAEFGGTGLGLNISKNFIELLGGEIKLDSEIGIGTTFSFTLPLSVETSNLIPEEKKYTETTAQFRSNIKILLAEDNNTNAKLALQVLKSKDYKVDRVSDGLQVLDALEHNVYDLILMDIQMPNMDGIEATKIIRGRNTSYSTIPIIALTAHSFIKEAEICENAGMSGYISKPFRPHEMYEAINSMLINKEKNILEFNSSEQQKTSIV